MNNGPLAPPDPLDPGAPRPGIYAPVNLDIDYFASPRGYVGQGVTGAIGQIVSGGQSRTAGATNPGILDPATISDDNPSYYLHYKQTYGGMEISFSIDPDTGITTPDPSTLGTPQDAPHDFSDPYTLEMVRAAAMAAIAAAPWTDAGAGSARREESSTAANYTEVRLRFGVRVAHAPGSATVLFRSRQGITQNGFYAEETDDGTLYIGNETISYTGETITSLSLAGHESEIVWTDWLTISAGDMGNHQSRAFCGPGDLSFVTLAPTINIWSIEASKLHAGFREYVTPADAPGVIPETAAYEVETATALPGATGTFSGARDYTGNTFSADVPFWAWSQFYGLDAPADQRTARQNLATLAPTRRTFRNGLAMTLTGKIETSDVLDAAETYVNAYAARAPTDPLPTPPKWMVAGGAGGGQGPADFDGAEVEVARYEVSADGARCHLRRSVYTVPIPQVNISPFQVSYPPVYNAGDIPVTWEEVTINLVTGERSAPVAKSATYHYDTDPDATPAPDFVYGPETVELPAPGTSVVLRNFRCGPGAITELEDPFTFEVTPGR